MNTKTLANYTSSKQINQYELVLAMATYIRQNPDALMTLKLKQCKSQSEQFLLFSDL